MRQAPGFWLLDPSQDFDELGDLQAASADAVRVAWFVRRGFQPEDGKLIEGGFAEDLGLVPSDHNSLACSRATDRAWAARRESQEPAVTMSVDDDVGEMILARLDRRALGQLKAGRDQGRVEQRAASGST